MYPLNDNDLDRLSRDAADQYDVDQSTSGWEALENRLNKELPLKEEKERRRFLFWLFLIVLLAGAGLLWMMTGTTNHTIQMAHRDGILPAQHETKNTTPAANQPSPNAGTSQQDTPTGSVPAPATVTPATGAASQQHPAAPALPSQADNSKTSTPAAANGKPSASLPALQEGKPGQPTVARHHTYDTRSKANNKSGKKINGRQEGIMEKLHNHKPYGKETVQDDQLLRASRVTAAGIKAGEPGPIKAPPLPIPATDRTAAAKTPQKKKDNTSKGFEIGLVAGPDMSNVKFTNTDKAGINAGLQIGYRFSDRWSVNTGLLYTRKNYTAQGKDWTKYGWWRNVDIHTVQGYCKMFEIPLNVRYDLSVNKNQRWFASAGSSSYIMTSEYYNCDYTYNGMRRNYPIKRDSTSTYLFSILNLSAGFERTLSKRFTFQAEPYFKFPVKGLGYGKLDLNSYGIYFSLKYKLGK